MSKTASWMVGALVILAAVLWGALHVVDWNEKPPNDPQTVPGVLDHEQPAASSVELPVVLAEEPVEMAPMESVDGFLTKQTLVLEEATGPAPVFDASDYPHKQRGDNTVRLYVPGEFFEQKYRGATLVELAEAEGRTKLLSSQLMQEAPAHFFASGGGESTVSDWTDPADIDFDEALSQAKAVPQKPSQGLIQTSRSEPIGPNGGQVLKQQGKLPWAEYVALYDANDELFWLMGELRRRQKELK